MKKIVCGVTAAAVLFGGVTLASAKVNSYNIAANNNNNAILTAANYQANAKLRPDVKVNIDGVNQTFYNVQGEEVFPILYNGSTYLPIRAIGEIMNKNVNWDKNTNTATISGQRTTESTKGTPNDAAVAQDIVIYCRSDYTIVIDGTTRTFKDANGNSVEPVVYNGSIYLPLRAIGEMMGKTVKWDSVTNTASLTQSLGGEVTDFDTSNSSGQTTPPTSTTTPAGQITVDQAKQIALNQAGKSANDVQFVYAGTEWDDGYQNYKIAFLTTTNNIKYKYVYHISMTGTITDFDMDNEGYVNNNNNNNNNSNQVTNVKITMEQAKQMALAKVSGATEANIVKIKLDEHRGGYKYEGKIVYNRVEYEFEIDANTGNFIEWEID